MASQEKYTILYGRLSQEDMQKKSGAEDDSNSIQNQRLLLEKYAREKGFTNTRFIYDDGYSGTNFRRPGWEELMELVESEQVATIIVKDMSRLGREYLQVGQYTELVFPSHGIRFIAVNDGVDSLCESTNDFTRSGTLSMSFMPRTAARKGARRRRSRRKRERASVRGRPTDIRRTPTIRNGTSSPIPTPRRWCSTSSPSARRAAARRRSPGSSQARRCSARAIITTRSLAWS